jgi:hypothetical protein
MIVIVDSSAQASFRKPYDETVGRQAVVTLYVLTLVAVVVGVDVLFFRHHSGSE